MKYAASHSDATGGAQGTSTTPISAPSVQQWVNISQTTAIANSPNVAGCSTCHLITEAEYLTIAQNVLSVASNWSTGTVGSGFIYRGHNDNAPANALVADPSDANGYAGTGNVSNSDQRRTLTLTNGEVIWDMAGNIWEWTSGVTNGTTAQQPGITGNGWNWREWTAITNPGSLSPNPNPATTGIAGAVSWTSGNGIGAIYSNSDDTGLYGFLRGGSWNRGSYAGVLTLYLHNGPGSTSSRFGFRVSR
jgi:formylglycine-generating enzyme required for sulfatase activity